MKIFYISFHCAGDFVRGGCYLFRRNDIVFSIVYVCVCARCTPEYDKDQHKRNYGSWEIVKCENEGA